MKTISSKLKTIIAPTMIINSKLQDFTVKYQSSTGEVKIANVKAYSKKEVLQKMEQHPSIYWIEYYHLVKKEDLI